MRFRPCIDLHDGVVKQIVGSTLGGDPAALRTNFVAALPPEHYAAMYRRDGLAGGHVIMLGPGNEAAAAAALAEYPGGLQIGGGITPQNAGRWLAAGAAKVIVTSYIFVDGRLSRERLRELNAAVGAERLVLDLSCRRRGAGYCVATNRWQTFTDVELTAASLAELAGWCGELLVHAVDVEGMQQGVDRELVALLARIAPLPTTYAGGIRSLADMQLIRDAGGGRIDFTVGSALDIFGGSLAYSRVVAFDREGRT